MSTVRDIGKAIQQLPPEQIFRLREVIQHRFDAEWDRQFAGDVDSGLFDEMAEVALVEHRAGKSTPLPQHEKLDHCQFLGGL